MVISVRRMEYTACAVEMRNAYLGGSDGKDEVYLLTLGSRLGSWITVMNIRLP
jgi:hypothetical protein